MQHSSQSDIAFRLFLLVNATLFLRPAELMPALLDVPIYEFAILGALLFGFPAIRTRFRLHTLRRQPVSLCVVGVLLAILLSHLTHMYFGGMVDGGVMFLKTLIYYALLVGLVDTPQRLKTFVTTVAVCASLMISLCVADYLGWTSFQFIEHVADRDGVDLTGSVTRVMRMRGTGIFQDPNDLAMLIVAATCMCLYLMTDRSRSAARYLWLIPIVILVIGLFCTRSRGGLLAAGGAVFVFSLYRYGRTAAFAAVGAGLCALPLIAGRQAEISLEGGTGQERIELWHEGFYALRSSDLLFGIGQGFYGDVAGLVAHNSFVHAFVELGLFGGTCFFGCFFLAGLALWRLGQGRARLLHPELARFQPWLAAIVTGWCVAMLSLSRCYVVPTYMIVGLAAAWLNVSAPYLRPCLPLVAWDRRNLTRLAMGSAAMFVGFFAFSILFRG